VKRKKQMGMSKMKNGWLARKNQKILKGATTSGAK